MAKRPISLAFARPNSCFRFLPPSLFLSSCLGAITRVRRALQTLSKPRSTNPSSQTPLTRRSPSPRPHHQLLTSSFPRLSTTHWSTPNSPCSLPERPSTRQAMHFPSSSSSHPPPAPPTLSSFSLGPSPLLGAASRRGSFLAGGTTPVIPLERDWEEDDLTSVHYGAGAGGGGGGRKLRIGPAGRDRAEAAAARGRRGSEGVLGGEGEGVKKAVGEESRRCTYLSLLSYEAARG